MKSGYYQVISLTRLSSSLVILRYWKCLCNINEYQRLIFFFFMEGLKGIPPTWCNLRGKDVDINVTCGSCGVAKDDYHVLFSYPYAFECWANIILMQLLLPSLLLLKVLSISWALIINVQWKFGAMCILNEWQTTWIYGHASRIGEEVSKDSRGSCSQRSPYLAKKFEFQWGWHWNLCKRFSRYYYGTLG